jgi:putative ABC transport system permease protein
VGVSADVFQNGNVQTGTPGPAVYVPYRLNPGGLTAVILVRSAQTEATVRDLRAELAKIDPDLAPFAIMTFDETPRVAMWGIRFFGALIGALSLMALVMASVGLYGVTAHGVNQCTREFGIRSALGASRGRLIWMVVRQPLPRILAGLAMGWSAQHYSANSPLRS